MLSLRRVLTRTTIAHAQQTTPTTNTISHRNNTCIRSSSVQRRPFTPRFSSSSSYNSKDGDSGNSSSDLRSSSGFIHGEVLDRAVDLRHSRPGDRIDVPYEITVTDAMQVSLKAYLYLFFIKFLIHVFFNLLYHYFIKISSKPNYLFLYLNACLLL
jgi:hypothetical protein